jgi:serine/threonine-protein kinase
MATPEGAKGADPGTDARDARRPESPAATVDYGDPDPRSRPALDGGDTVVDGGHFGVAAPARESLAATIAASVEISAAPPPPRDDSGVRRVSALLASATAARTTVLPRVAASGADSTWQIDNRPRYEPLRSLGAGGVGEVMLVRDHDIERPVALKRLRPDQLGTTSLLRFAEEIKTIGRLEHPNIVPIHDVGVDEGGQHYFVMKYVEGETLERIIDQLAAGDRAYRKRFSWEHRTEIFISILNAVRYAHAHGIIHRDLKPANIMVGPYGEVTVMDWGLAKEIRRASPARDAKVDPLSSTATGEADVKRKLVETHTGALLGTPLYMAPEQAAGDLDAMDERSDVFSLCVLFHELLGAEHYLADKRSVAQVLSTLTTELPSHRTLFQGLIAKGVPCELVHFVVKGMRKDPRERYQSVDEMVEELERIQAGDIRVSCHVTAFKRGGRALLGLVDRHPHIYTAALAGTLGLALLGAVMGAMRIAHLL